MQVYKECRSNYNSLRCLQGSTFPEDPCGAATLNLQSMNDNCSMAIQQLGGDSSSLIYLYLGDCPTRFQSYVTACSEQFGNDTNDVSAIYNGYRS